MTGFADFPNELIVEVWRQVVDPSSVENFALTDKRIHALGGRFIKEHNELKVKFSSVPYYVSGKDSGLAETLRILLQNCRAALYVRELLSEDWPSMRESSDDSVQIDHNSFPNETTELSRKLIKDSPLIAEDEIESWLDTIEAGSESAFFFLVLTMLPNLQSLTMNRIYLVESLLFDAVKRITESGHTEALSRLTEVRLFAGGYRIKDFQVSDWVFTFASLPSLKLIKAWGIDPDCECLDHNYHNDDGIGNSHGSEDTSYCSYTVCHKRRPTLPPKTSSVKHLALINCEINARRVASILEGLKALESFEWEAIYASTNPMEIVHALLDHAKHTLRRLRIRSSGVVMRLAEFEVMKELDIGYNLLFDHRVRGDPMDMLPSSIEIVTLCRLKTFTHAVVGRDVQEMTTEKANRFPNLKQLTINVLQPRKGFIGYIDGGLNEEMVSYMKQKCEDVGIHFSVAMYSRLRNGRYVTEASCQR